MNEEDTYQQKSEERNYKRQKENAQKGNWLPRDSGTVTW